MLMLLPLVMVSLFAENRDDDVDDDDNQDDCNTLNLSTARSTRVTSDLRLFGLPRNILAAPARPVALEDEDEEVIRYHRLGVQVTLGPKGRRLLSP